MATVDFSGGPDALLERFQTHGYVILRGVLEPEVVERARAAARHVVDLTAERLLASGKISQTHPDEPLETRLIRLCEGCMEEGVRSYRQELQIPELYGVFFHPGLLDAVEQLIGGEIRLYPNYTMRPKLPEWGPGNVAWHQDGAYTAWWDFSDRPVDPKDVERLGMVNAWTPLVPARVENGCMQFVRASHLLGLVPHERRDDELAIVQSVVDPLESQAIPVELDPGDVVLFHNLLFHRGLPNRSARLRWSIDWRYQDLDKPTLRREQGHVARSRREPGRAVPNAEAWGATTFG